MENNGNKLCNEQKDDVNSNESHIISTCNETTNETNLEMERLKKDDEKRKYLLNNPIKNLQQMREFCDLFGEEDKKIGVEPKKESEKDLHEEISDGIARIKNTANLIHNELQNMTSEK